MMMLRMQVVSRTHAPYSSHALIAILRQWNMNVDLVHREGLAVPHHYYNDPSLVYIL
jgi:hypothetical protein